MVTVQNEPFDLILLGRGSRLVQKAIDQRLREKYPELLILKIENATEPRSEYQSRVTDSAPRHVLEVLHEMLGDGVRLKPPDYPGNLMSRGPYGSWAGRPERNVPVRPAVVPELPGAPRPGRLGSSDRERVAAAAAKQVAGGPSRRRGIVIACDLLQRS
jgi:hypothetical protein